MLFDNDESIIAKRARRKDALRDDPSTVRNDAPTIRNDASTVSNEAPSGQSTSETRRVSILESRAQRAQRDEVEPPPEGRILESRAERAPREEVEPPPEGSILESRRRSILPARRSRALQEDEVAPPVRRRASRHAFLWSLVVVVLIATVVVVSYGYWAVAAYHGRMNLLPALQTQLIADGHRIDDAGHALEDQKATFGQRLGNAASVLAGRLQPPPTRAEVDQRVAVLQGQINTLESAQQSADQQLNQLQGQMAQMKSQPQAVPPVAAPNPPAVTAPNPAAAPARIDFQVNLHQSRELSPGIRLEVSRIDALHQRYDASVKLTGGQTLWIHSRPAQEPVKFYSARETNPDELVITQITRNSVAGYLQLEQGPPAAAESR